MHHGQIPGPPNPVAPTFQPGAPQPFGAGFDNHQHQNGSNFPDHQSPNRNGPSPTAHPKPHSIPSANATTLDDLVSGAAKDADEANKVTAIKSERNESTGAPKLDSKPNDAHEEKKGKKEKEKVTKLVYSDNEISPEEKMAQLPRYAFVPSGKEETVLGEATTAAVTGVATRPDDVLDVHA